MVTLSPTRILPRKDAASKSLLLLAKNRPRFTPFPDNDGQPIGELDLLEPDESDSESEDYAGTAWGLAVIQEESEPASDAPPEWNPHKEDLI